MALIQFGGGVASIRGSIGGTTFSKNKGGSYVRNKTTPVNSGTSRLSEVRTLFGALSSSWSGLTSEQQQTWINQAPNYPRTNIFGDPAPLTGQGLYNSLNGQLVQLSQPKKDIAIPPLDVAAAFFAQVQVNSTANTLSITSVPSTEFGNIIGIYATAPQSAGKRFVKTKYRLVGFIPNGTPSGDFDFTAGYVFDFGVQPNDIPAGSKVFVKVRNVLIVNGQASTDFASNGAFSIVA